MHSVPLTLSLLVSLCLLATPAAAFGAGDIPSDEGLNGHVWRHGDIATAVLLVLPISFETKYKFTKLETMTVYFGNWLRDYSQVVDVSLLKTGVSESLLRAVVSVLGFMHFGFATNEFDVTQERLGCYRHIEHIDNPKDYPPNAKSHDDRLRGPVSAEELEIDPETGMKNYIANSGKGWETSADYISGELRECIAKGRRGRQGDQQAMSDALIHLGGALHTLEDFAAHSNFTELCLNQLGEQDVFAVVGDSCKVTIPSTGQQVAPLVTGTFGALDVLQSILGEADDKAALGTKGELDKLLDNLSVGGSAFQAMYERLKPVIEALSKIPGQDKAEGLLSDLNKVNDVATKAKNEPSAFQPKNNRVDGPSELWDAIEPAFALHDHVAKWLLENDFDIPFISESIETITRYIDNFVYSFLALVIEPSVREMRNAAEAGRKELLEKEKGLLKNDKEPLENDKNLPDNIYNPGSQDSNPSHSVIAKDHFSNYLNPPAGLVATVTTNWTTQQVVHCWDDSSIDCEARIAEILGILHHPAFASATGASFIQRIMYEAVEQWWSRHNEDEKKNLRSVLNISGVEHNRNNHKVTEAYFKDKKGGAAVFEGSAPGGIDRPKPGFGLDKLVNEVSEKLETAVQALGEGLKNAGEVVVDTAELVGDAVGEAFSDAGSVINDAASEVGSVIIGAVDAVDDAVDTVATGVVQGANDAVEFVGDAAITVGDGVIDFGKGAVDTVVEVTDTIGDGLNTVGDAIGSVMPWNW